MLERPAFTPNESASREQYTPLRHKRERQKLVVRTKKGEVLYGMCFALNKSAPSFHLDLLDRHGKSMNRTTPVHFKDIKAVFYVKSFDGKFSPEEFTRQTPPPNREIVVEFEDGEALIGRPLHQHWNEEPRFYIMPEDNESNNLLVLIERSAVKAVHDAHEYRHRRRNEVTAFLRNHMKPGMSQDECLGDYYFSKHDYRNAARHYRTAREQHGDDAHLKKKLCTARYNLAVRHIKQKDYVQALRMMERVLELDPKHTHAFEKARKLREHLAKHPPENPG